jgi:hypothetical protein
MRATYVEVFGRLVTGTKTEARRTGAVGGWCGGNGGPGRRVTGKVRAVARGVAVPLTSAT